MDKQSMISLIISNLRMGIITREDLLNIVGVSQTPSASPQGQAIDGNKSFSATNILYTIGGIVLLIGIGTLVFRFWSDLSSGVRIALTLGIAVVAYISGLLLRSDSRSLGISNLMELIAAVLAPIGIFITLNEMGVQPITIGWVAGVAIVLTCIYLLSLALFRSIIFSFFSIAFGTWAVYSIVAFFLDQAAVSSPGDVYKYLTLAIGICFLFLSSYVKSTSQKALVGVLDGFGTIGILGAIVVLGGYKPTQSFLWEIIGIVAVCGGLYLANVTQNKTVLRTTALFVFILIAKFTGEYFSDSFGWPIALMIGGIALIAAGYGLVVFNKRVTTSKS